MIVHFEKQHTWFGKQRNFVKKKDTKNILKSFGELVNNLFIVKSFRKVEIPETT
jgi:hypothetical protein